MRFILIACGSLAALAAWAPLPAIAGYDVSHILRQTCEPGGRLVVAKEWRRGSGSRSRPGAVVACVGEGKAKTIQIAAGTEESLPGFTCTYISVDDGAGADSCFESGELEGTPRLLTPLIAVELRPGKALAIVGQTGSDVRSVSVRGNPQAVVRFLPVGPALARRIDAEIASTGYFVAQVRAATACEDSELTASGRDEVGRVIMRSRVNSGIRLIGASDPRATTLRHYCELGQGTRPDRLSTGITSIIDTLRLLAKQVLSQSVIRM